MDGRILVLRQKILANLNSSLTLAKLSAELNISASRLRQLIKEETGMAFGEYVRQLRLGRARELLETTLMRAQEIGAEVGIYDQSYFNRIFKKKYGLSPKKYHFKHCALFKSNDAVHAEKN